MNTDNTYKQEAEQYVLGELDEISKKDFEKRMSSNELIRKEVELQRLIISGVRKTRLKNIIEEEEKAIRQKKSGRKIGISTISLLAAASLIGFIYIGYLKQSRSLADPFYSTYPNIYELPSRGTEKLEPTETDLLFFEALTQMEENNNRKAVKQLNLVKKNQQDFKVAGEDVINWYLALGNLKIGKKKKAKSYLQEVINHPGSDFQTEAEELFKKLR